MTSQDQSTTGSSAPPVSPPTGGVGKVAILPNWTLKSEGGKSVIVLTGDWIMKSGPLPVISDGCIEAVPAAQALSVAVDSLGQWDGGLIEFLWDVKRAASSARIPIDWRALPNSAQKLLQLLPQRLTAPDHSTPRPFAPLFWIGGHAADALAEVGAVTQLLAATAMSTVLALHGRARVRREDVIANIIDAGPSALLIVSIVNFLVGAILAFVGAAELRKFAAGVYVANLVGIALVRELAAVMTAIVMAGRTGGAYAARIATMEGGEEIDALQVLGIPLSDYLLLPSILALILTMPLLYLYGCLVGVLGGLIVSNAMLDVTATTYVHQTLGAVSLGQFAFGFLKSIAFAVLIGVTSCRVGLRAGRSAADVGAAATQAVVIGIVGVIALDAIFAVMAEMIGF